MPGMDPSAAGFPYYPTNDFGPLMKGVVIGGLGIFHVFLAQFAIGGGMLMTYFEVLLGRGRLPEARAFGAGLFRVLVLVSFVVGALTGVGMWLTSIQVSPRTIGLMVQEFHWLWAIEWTFFCLEVVAGYAFYRFGEGLPHRTRLALLGLYSAASWFSLFWINGILSWQLTPGAAWSEGRPDLWSGFFNPTFWPSLIFRTVVSAATAALVAMVVVNASDLERATRERLIQHAAHLFAPLVLLPPVGLWYFAVVPEDSRRWVLGGSVPMNLFLGVAAGASLLVGGYAVVGILVRRLYVSGATATLLVALAFGATGAAEFVREGMRKPFTIREVLYSNAITPGEVARLREQGSVSADPYPLRDAARYPTAGLALGARVYRLQCSVCHTMEGMNGVVHLASGWTREQKRMNLSMLQRTKPFMPPFAGSAVELEALVGLLEWEAAGAPTAWSDADDPGALARVQAWLDEAGTEPGARALARRP